MWKKVRGYLFAFLGGMVFLLTAMFLRRGIGGSDNAAYENVKDESKDIGKRTSEANGQVERIQEKQREVVNTVKIDQAEEPDDIEAAVKEWNK